MSHRFLPQRGGTSHIPRDKMSQKHPCDKVGIGQTYRALLLWLSHVEAKHASPPLIVPYGWVRPLNRGRRGWGKSSVIHRSSGLAPRHCAYDSSVEFAEWRHAALPEGRGFGHVP